MILRVSQFPSFNFFLPCVRLAFASPSRRDDGPADDTANDQLGSNTADRLSRGTQPATTTTTSGWLWSHVVLDKGFPATDLGGVEGECDDDDCFSLDDADENPTDDDDDGAPVLGMRQFQLERQRTDDDDDDG